MQVGVEFAMSLNRRSLTAGLAAGWILPVVGQPADAPVRPRTLVFGLITPRAAEQTRQSWQPFVERMGQALNVNVQLRVFPDQSQLVQAFRQGLLDLGWMGNGPALEVAESGAGAVFAQMVTKDGRLGFNSVLVMRQDAGERDLADVLKHAARLRFSDGDPKSASGHLVPAYYAFQKNGVEQPAQVFMSVRQGSHQGNLLALAKGEVDVVTANNEELDFFARDYPDLARTLRVVWTSPLIPQSPLVWKVSLPAELRRRILRFTVSFGRDDPEEKRILESLNNLSGFRQSTNRQLVMVADLEMFKARQAINLDTGLSAEERARRIEETIRRGSRLDLLLKLSSALPI